MASRRPATLDATARVYNVESAHTADVYADGTPARGDGGSVLDAFPAATWVALLAQGPRTLAQEANPAAGTVHAREAGAPWRRAGEAEVAADNAKAAPLLAAKRFAGLAKQTSTGLLTHYGVRVDHSDLAVRLEGAFAVKRAVAAEEDAYSEKREAAEAARRAALADAVDTARAAAEAVEAERLRALRAAAAQGGGRKKGSGRGRGRKSAADTSAEEAAAAAALSEAEVAAAVAAAGAAAAEEARGAAEAAVPLPGRPQHSKEALRAIELADAVLRHDLARVLALLGLRSKRRLDRTMVQLSATARASAGGI